MAGKELLPYLGIGKKILCMLPTEQIRLEAVRATEDVLLERLRKKARSGETLTKEALGMTILGEMIWNDVCEATEKCAPEYDNDKICALLKEA